MSNTIDTQTKTLIEGITSDILIAVAVKTDDDLREATRILGSVKANVKELKTKKSAALTPLKESIKEINSWFKPAEDHLASMESSIKDAMLAYHNQKEAAARKKLIVLAAAWKAEQEFREKSLIRPGGGTNNALFQVNPGNGDSATVTAYLQELGELLAAQPKEGKQL